MTTWLLSLLQLSQHNVFHIKIIEDNYCLRLKVVMMYLYIYIYIYSAGQFTTLMYGSQRYTNLFYAG